MLDCFGRQLEAEQVPALFGDVLRALDRQKVVIGTFDHLAQCWKQLADNCDGGFNFLALTLLYHLHHRSIWAQLLGWSQAQRARNEQD